MRRIAIIVLTLLCYCGLFTLAARTQAQSPDENQSLALVGAKIYPSPTDEPITNGVVLIKYGKIAAVGNRNKVNIPKNSRIIDCNGLTLTAGFWNSHVHFSEGKWAKAADIPADQLTRQLQDMLTRYGFTTVLDTGSLLENTKILRERIEAGQVDGPRILTAGEPLASKDGTPIYLRPFKLPEIETPAQAKEKVRERAAGGANTIKIFSGSLISGDGKVQVMSLELIKAVTSEAHSLGKLVLAHPQSAEGLEMAVDGGVDILLHTVPDSGKLARPLLAKMKQAKAALVPTLKLWRYVGLNLRRPESTIQRFQDLGVEQLRDYFEMGGEILFGTDAGFMTDYEPTDEYAQMMKAGMGFQQILTALTTAPAKRFAVSGHTGRIATGMDADIVLLAGDPSVDVKLLSNVKYTLRKGKVIYESR